MTWKEFKEAVEKQGMKDYDKIWYIDVHPDDVFGDEFKVENTDPPMGKSIS